MLVTNKSLSKREDHPRVIGGIYYWDEFFHNGAYHTYTTEGKVVYIHDGIVFDEFQDQAFWYHFLEDEWVGGMGRI